RRCEHRVCLRKPMAAYCSSLETRVRKGLMVGGRFGGVAMGSDGPQWRVFLSHTSELRDFPAGGSYVTAVERAVSATGHVIVDMADFPSVDEAPADVCVSTVQGCEVYVGVPGTRYGSSVRDR